MRPDARDHQRRVRAPSRRRSTSRRSTRPGSRSGRDGDHGVRVGPRRAGRPARSSPTTTCCGSRASARARCATCACRSGRSSRSTTRRSTKDVDVAALRRRRAVDGDTDVRRHRARQSERRDADGEGRADRLGRAAGQRPAAVRVVDPARRRLSPCRPAVARWSRCPPDLADEPDRDRQDLRRASRSHAEDAVADVGERRVRAAPRARARARRACRAGRSRRRPTAARSRSTGGPGASYCSRSDAPTSGWPTVSITVAACTPPITEMRAFGHMNRKRGEYARPHMP